MKRKYKLLLSAAIIGGSLLPFSTTNAINYLPGVTAEMSDAEYWTSDSEV